MTEQEMIRKLITIFPSMELGEDNDGQLIIYTNTQLQYDSEGVGTVTEMGDES